MKDVSERAKNRLVMLDGHFAHPVRVEHVEPIGSGVFLVRVRHANGAPDETQILESELEAALAKAAPKPELVDAQDLFLWVESQRIKHAFAHDPLFAVSMSGVRGLPHQIEAVYRHMLPQPRLRFVLADDPGAGKTIMAGLLLKELKLRGAVERILILSPAPLTTQWQDEMLEKFDEQFEIVSGEQVRYQLGQSPWERFPLAISSIDFAKRDDVRDELLRTQWDLVVVDEAHKASAFTKRGRDERVVKTKRYSLVEGVAQQADRLLLLTATPHSGDEDRFTRFLGLLDPDQFSTPDLVKKQIANEGNPYFLRRQKEDLVDEHNHALFVERHVRTQPFQLSTAEYALYQDVTEYVNRYLGPSAGSRGNAVALARTVLQRRLASSLGAIRSSLMKRADRLSDLIDQLNMMPSADRNRRLASLGRMPAESDFDDDGEAASDDMDETVDDALVTEVTSAEQLSQLRAEVRELRKLVVHADRVRHLGDERKLVALRECLKRAEFDELKDGRGKLLIFTEHRDTLDYLEEDLRKQGYTVCTIHGGQSPTERKRAQHDFRQNKQICIATEAAGEGINLQFCHLMINYDLPWNPVRLEQRMGRVHRIGQSADCWIFNFCATNTIEGQLLAGLHARLEAMRDDLDGRVYDVIGELLTINGIDFERLVKETLASPTRANRDAAVAAINRLNPDKLAEYEKDTGIALAKKYVDIDWVRGQNFLSEERRLMPEYAEAFFLRAASRQRLRVERRADQLLRIEHVPVALRSEDLAAVKHRGRPDSEYRKLTFKKEERDRVEHEDSVLCSPGHPLFAALAESLERDLAADGIPQGAAAFVDPGARAPYFVHLFAYEVVGEDLHGAAELAFAEVVAVIEDHDGLHRGPADVLHTLTPATPTGARKAAAVSPEKIKKATDWLRVQVQLPRSNAERINRLDQAKLRASYLEEAMEAQKRRLEGRWDVYDTKVASGDDSYRLQRDNTARQLQELKHRRAAKLESLNRLGVVRSGKVTHLGSASVVPPSAPEHPDVDVMRASSKEVEDAAVEVAMAFERQQGWEPQYLGHLMDGTGFDIRSTRTLPDGNAQVRRIEVKGRADASGDVGLYRTEWYAAQRWAAGYWLYVVYSATTNPVLLRVQDPYHTLPNVSEIRQVTGYRVPGASIRAHAVVEARAAEREE
ncbi:helicase-related protein [Streptomyces sp. DH10]|uniref:helicase-related protein n=1 Tax=Streptomyces sp. DH10 TaxID=3040121 RepID=UPI00244177DB|nr:helicase-related protein [Streptomyces sp. DH10]MDG9711664.1 helicase-related protein [Streptomyces sp. DH10]